MKAILKPLGIILHFKRLFIEGHPLGSLLKAQGGSLLVPKDAESRQPLGRLYGWSWHIRHSTRLSWFILATWFILPIASIRLDSCLRADWTNWIGFMPIGSIGSMPSCQLDWIHAISSPRKHYNFIQIYIINNIIRNSWFMPTCRLDQLDWIHAISSPQKHYNSHLDGFSSAITDY